MNDRELESRLRARYRARAGEAETAPLSLRLDVGAIPRTATAPRRLSRVGRGITLLAAAALLLVGGALVAGADILRLPTVVPPMPEPQTTFPSSSESVAPSASPVAGPGGAWIPTGSMVTRGGERTVRLLDGRVLVMGGDLAAELYDPATGTWSTTGNMLKPTVRGIESWVVFPALLLHDGRVLLGESTYDPATGTWSATGPIEGLHGGDSSPFWMDAATVLRDGKVLATGRYGPSAKLYDPAAGTWAATGKPNVPRGSPAAALLTDGKVLLAGGWSWYNDPEGNLATRTEDSAEVYDPATASWTAIADMPVPAGSAAVPLPDGRVLVAGMNADGFVAMVYDPGSGSWTELPARPGVTFSSAALLSDGAVLVTDDSEGREGRPRCATADLYDPATGSWTTISGIPWCGVSSFTPLLDGTVLVAGGRECKGDGEDRVCVPNGEAALYVPPGVRLPTLPAFPSAPPPVLPSPTPEPTPTARPTPFPAAVGPVPPNARSWTVTVDNRSSEPATLFVAGLDENGMSHLAGSATPNVVPAGATVKVTFRFPADEDEWIYVNPRPGEGGALVSAADIGIPGKIVVTADGQVGWLSP